MANSTSGKLVKHSTIYAIGGMCRQIVGFLMLPIYTRFLSPSDYGVVGLLTFAMALMEPFFGARLGEAMPKYYFEEDQPDRKNAVISTALIITASVSGTTAAIFFALQSSTSQLLFGSSTYALAVGLFGINILTQAVEYYGMTYIRILQRPYLYISISLTKLVTQLTLNIILVIWLKLGVLGVVLSGVISSSLYALCLASFMLAKTGFNFNGALAKVMLKFSWPLWFVGLSSLYIYSGNRYFIRVFSSLGDVGLYELAAKFATILSILIWQPFNQFWETERFNYYKSGNTKVYSETFRILSIVLVIITLAIGILAEPVIRIMAGPEFYAAYKAVPFLTLAFLFSCFSSYVSFSLLVTENTKQVTYVSYAAAAIITLLNFTLIPAFGFQGAAIALAITLVVEFIATYKIGRKYFNLNLNSGSIIKLTIVLLLFLAISLQIKYMESFWLDVLARAALLITAIIAVAIIERETLKHMGGVKQIISFFKMQRSRTAP